MEKKFQSIIDNYINGNISDCKSQVKKLSKENRKALYKYATEATTDILDHHFFFNLI